MRITATAEMIQLAMLQEAMNELAHSREDDERVIATHRTAYVTPEGHPGEAQTYRIRLEADNLRIVGIGFSPNHVKDGASENIPTMIQFYEGKDYPKTAEEWNRSIGMSLLITQEEDFVRHAQQLAVMIFRYLLDGEQPPPSTMTAH